LEKKIAKKRKIENKGGEILKAQIKKCAKIFFWIIWFILIIISIYFFRKELFLSNDFNQRKKKEQFVQISVDSNNISNQVFYQIEKEEPKWVLKIPSIYLNKEIEEGTSQEILKRAIGHFPETPLWDGNVCFAAHNVNGKESGFFKDIKKLNIGDEIEYQKDGKIRIYEVIENTVIIETDWSKLEATKENRLTLITCEEGLYEYRRCIQAIEKERKQ